METQFGFTSGYRVTLDDNPTVYVVCQGNAYLNTDNVYVWVEDSDGKNQRRVHASRLHLVEFKPLKLVENDCV